MKNLLTLCLVLLLAACASAPRNPMATWSPSPNFDQRRAVVIVLHFTQQGSVEESLHTLKTANSGGRVSAHYLIGEDGGIHQLVSDQERAWHAGGGRWGAITDLNSASIGIEIDNDGEEPYSEAQIQALLRLLDDLTTRLRIPRSQVIGHSDLAPTRKVDPGAHFPWKRLFDAGFGIWPQGELVDPPPGFDGWLALRAIGYGLDDRAATLRAFRMRFRGLAPSEPLTAQLEPEDLRILHALTRD
ncbi:N-acetylmuramoyl-L-alanine amidase [Luteimonas sp. e5]